MRLINNIQSIAVCKPGTDCHDTFYLTLSAFMLKGNVQRHHPNVGQCGFPGTDALMFYTKIETCVEQSFIILLCLRERAFVCPSYY